jgi:1-acyl-sn-glycerol-3-phosphate acyltransferase
MGVRDTLLGAAYTARISAPTVVDAFLGRVSMERSDERLAWWSRKLLDSAEVSLEIRGSENVPDGALVLMSNHRSYYDIPTVFCAIPGRVRMVAKKELFRVPVFGSAMLAAGFVKIDREQRHSAIASLRESQRLLESGTRVWIAPEGTRSKDGRLGTFKSGGFHLALQAGVPILPIALEGTQNILPHDGLVVRKGAHVTATILPAIDAPSYGAERRKELMADVRKAIAGALGE